MNCSLLVSSVKKMRPVTVVPTWAAADVCCASFPSGCSYMAGYNFAPGFRCVGGKSVVRVVISGASARVARHGTTAREAVAVPLSTERLHLATEFLEALDERKRIGAGSLANAEPMGRLLRWYDLHSRSQHPTQSQPGRRERLVRWGGGGGWTRRGAGSRPLGRGRGLWDGWGTETTYGRRSPRAWGSGERAVLSWATADSAAPSSVLCSVPAAAEKWWCSTPLRRTDGPSERLCSEI
jgi:hypothetical protein